MPAFDNMLRSLGGLGTALGVGDQNNPNFLQRWANAADPETAAQNSALLALAHNRDNGVTNPIENLNTAGQYLPQYAQAAAQISAQNPLAALLQNSGKGGAGSASAPDMTVTGDAFLKTLPAGVASQIKGYAEGKIQPSPYLMRTPAGQQMMQLVSQYDPSFDAVNYGARAATQKDFTSGKAAQNITAINTAMGHLLGLRKAYDNLDQGTFEGNGDFPALNAVKNFIGTQLGNENIQKNTADVSTKAHAVSEELAKVFRSTGMAESDVKAWEDKIDAKATPAQQKAIIDGAIELMNSRLQALGQQYNQGMGTNKDGIQLLSPTAQQAYQQIIGEKAPRTEASGNLAADNAAQDPVARAKAAGYTDAEIQAYLAKKKGGK